MDAQKIIEEIKRELAQVKEAGHSIVTVEGLEKYLDALGPAAAKSGEIHVKLADYAHERNLAQYNAVQAFHREMLRSVIGYGQAALK